MTDEQWAVASRIMHEVVDPAGALTGRDLIDVRNRLERSLGELLDLERPSGLSAAALEATLSSVVNTIGGVVDGAPTHRGNFLQRLRELTSVERDFYAQSEDFDRLRSRLDHAYETIATFAGERDEARAQLEREHGSCQNVILGTGAPFGPAVTCGRERDADGGCKACR